MTEINQQLSNKAAISYQNRLTDKSLRKARTRTLIQTGGLLSLVGFLPFCGIEEGDDLQFDIQNGDKAAILLGILFNAFEQLPIEPTKEQFQVWKNIGVRMMKIKKTISTR